MNFSTKIIAAIAVIALLLGGWALVGGNAHQSALGGESNYDLLSMTSFRVGVSCNDSYSSTCQGTRIFQILNGTANCATGATTVGPFASSTIDCAISNVVSADRVFITLSSTTPASLLLDKAWASSTAGFIEVSLYNATSTSQAVAGATSSLSYLIVR